MRSRVGQISSRLRRSTVSLSLLLRRLMNHLANQSRKFLADLLSLYRSSLDRCTTRDRLLDYTAVADDTTRVVIPSHNALRLRIMFECHDAPTGGRRGREKTYLTVSIDFYCPPPKSVRTRTFALARSDIK